MAFLTEQEAQYLEQKIRYKLDIEQRFGTKIGIIWRLVESNYGNSDTVIGQVKIENEIEEKLWHRLIGTANKLSENLQELLLT